MARIKESTIDGNLVLLGNPIAFNPSNTMSISSLSLPSGYSDILSGNSMLARVLKANNSKYAIATIGFETPEAPRSGIRADEHNICLWSNDGIEIHTLGKLNSKIAEIDKNGRYLATAKPQARNSYQVRLYSSYTNYNIDDDGNYDTLPFTNNKYTVNNTANNGFGAPEIKAQVAESEIAELGNGLYIYSITVTMESSDFSISTGDIQLKDNLWFRVWLPTRSIVLNAQVSPVCDELEAYKGYTPYWFIEQTKHLTLATNGIKHLDICMTTPFGSSARPAGFSMIVVAKGLS